MKTFLNRIMCLFRESHDWALHWEPSTYRGINVETLTGSECRRCGKYRAA